MTSTKPYYAETGASALYYDLLTSADKSLAGDIDAYADLLEGPSSVLEIGVGTGRIALELVARGHSVVGLDLAPTMLRQAEAKRQALSPEAASRLKLVRGDMTSMSLGETFDAVFCTFFTLAHVPAGAAWRNVFKGVVRHLRPSGLATFHLPLEAQMRPPAPPADKPVFVQALAGGGSLALFMIERSFNPKIGRMDLVLDYVTTSAPGAAPNRSRERLTYYSADPNPYALAAGLEVAMAPIDIGGAGSIHVFRKP